MASTGPTLMITEVVPDLSREKNADLSIGWLPQIIELDQKGKIFKLPPQYPVDQGGDYCHPLSFLLVKPDGCGSPRPTWLSSFPVQSSRECNVFVC